MTSIKQKFKAEITEFRKNVGRQKMFLKDEVKLKKKSNRRTKLILKGSPVQSNMKENAVKRGEQRTEIKQGKQNQYAKLKKLN